MVRHHRILSRIGVFLKDHVNCFVVPFTEMGKARVGNCSEGEMKNFSLVLFSLMCI